MPADLKKPFSESCCDGGECSITEISCQPCGCDRGAKWVCKEHQNGFKYKVIKALGLHQDTLYWSDEALLNLLKAYKEDSEYVDRLAEEYENQPK